MVNVTALDGEWRAVKSINLALHERRLWVEIPTGFTQMQQQAPERALQWRLHVRQNVPALLRDGLPGGRFRAAP